MTQNEKELLLKDTCARIPYNIKCTYYDKCVGEEDEGTITGIQNETYFVIDGGCIDVENVKPYLYPLSSMTDELWDKEFSVCGITEFTRDSFKYGCETLEFNNSNPSLSSIVRFTNLLIKNHFDIHGLIPMGLAIDASKLNIY